MFFKKYWLKISNKENYYKYKNALSIEKKIEIFKINCEKQIKNIQKNLKNKKELSFLHSGHLGDILISLPVIKELSKTHKCNFYIESNKVIPIHIKNRKHSSGNVYLTEKNVEMILPLLKNQPYMQRVDKYTNQNIDIDLNLFREMPLNFNMDHVSGRWYSHVTGVHPDLTSPYLSVEPINIYKDKIIIIRNLTRKNYLISYNFLKTYKDLLFIGLKQEYEDLKKEVPNLEFYDCKDFLEMAQIIQSCKFFLGNLSFGYTIAEGLKVPRLLEASPDFPLMYPYGKNAYDFYFQEHFENLFKLLHSL